MSVPFWRWAKRRGGGTVFPPNLTTSGCRREHMAKVLAEDGVPVKTIRYCGVAHAFIDKLGFVPQAEDLCIEIAKAMKEM